MPSSSTSILAVTFSPASGYRLLITSSSSSWLSKLKAGTSIGREFTALCWLVYVQYVPVKLILYINILSYTCLCRAQPFYLAYSRPAFRLPLLSLALGVGQKKARTPIPSRSEGSGMPEVKIRKQCVLELHAAYFSVQLRSEFTRFSLSDGRYRYRYMCCKYTLFLISAEKRCFL